LAVEYQGLSSLERGTRASDFVDTWNRFLGPLQNESMLEGTNVDACVIVPELNYYILFQLANRARAGLRVLALVTKPFLLGDRHPHIYQHAAPVFAKAARGRKRRRRLAGKGRRRRTRGGAMTSAVAAEEVGVGVPGKDGKDGKDGGGEQGGVQEEQEGSVVAEQQEQQTQQERQEQQSENEEQHGKEEEHQDEEQRQPGSGSTDPPPITIAVHVRRGELHAVHRERLLSNRYYIGIVRRLLALLPATTATRVEVHTETPTKDFALVPGRGMEDVHDEYLKEANPALTRGMDDLHEFTSAIPNVTMRINEHAVEAFTAISHADIVVTSRSSFSLCAAVLSASAFLVILPPASRDLSGDLFDVEQAVLRTRPRLDDGLVVGEDGAAFWGKKRQREEMEGWGEEEDEIDEDEEEGDAAWGRPASSVLPPLVVQTADPSWVKTAANQLALEVQRRQHAARARRERREDRSQNTNLGRGEATKGATKEPTAAQPPQDVEVGVDGDSTLSGNTPRTFEPALARHRHGTAVLLKCTRTVDGIVIPAAGQVAVRLSPGAFILIVDAAAREVVSADVAGFAEIEAARAFLTQNVVLAISQSCGTRESGAESRARTTGAGAYRIDLSLEILRRADALAQPPTETAQSTQSGASAASRGAAAAHQPLCADYAIATQCADTSADQEASKARHFD
jgi:hypothetical protein